MQSISFFFMFGKAYCIRPYMMEKGNSRGMSRLRHYVAPLDMTAFFALKKSIKKIQKKIVSLQKILP